MLKKNKIKQQVCDFTAIFEPAEEGGYVVSIPSLPGCITQGDTFEEAESMAKDAIEGYLEAMKEMKEEIPIESGSFIISKISAMIPA